MINEPSTLKNHIEIVQNLSVEELQSKLASLQRNNIQLKKEIDQFQ